MYRLKKEIEEIVENSFNEFVGEKKLVKILFKKQKIYPITRIDEFGENLDSLNKKLANDLNEKLFSKKESNVNDVEYAQELIVEKIIQLKNDYHI